MSFLSQYKFEELRFQSGC